MPRKSDFMGRKTKKDYEMAEGYLNAPMAQPAEDVTDLAMQRRIKQAEDEKRKAKMQESIDKIKDDIRYSDEIDFREALRKAREREYKRRGF